MYFWSVSLVYQLSGQFLTFGQQKKIWSTKKKFGIPKKNWYTKKKFGRPKKNLVDKKNIWYTKKKLVDQKNEKSTGQLVYQRD